MNVKTQGDFLVAFFYQTELVCHSWQECKKDTIAIERVDNQRAFLAQMTKLLDLVRFGQHFVGPEMDFHGPLSRKALEICERLLGCNKPTTAEVKS